MNRYIARNLSKMSLTHTNIFYFSTIRITDDYFNLPLFAVVGASTDRKKFGNKVLRCYQLRQKLAIPVSNKEKNIEGVQCVDSLTTLAEVKAGTVKAQDIGVSIVTPPAVTKSILEEGVQLGFRHFFLQPGTYNEDISQYIESLRLSSPYIKIIQSCVLVELDCHP